MSGVKSDPVTAGEGRTVTLSAGAAIVDLPAVANVLAPLGAEAPYGVLNPAREDGGESRVERPRVDGCREVPQDLGAAARRVAGRTVAMIGPAATQAPGSVQIAVDEGVDGDHPGAGRHPSLATRIATSSSSASISDQSFGPMPTMPVNGFTTAIPSLSARLALSGPGSAWVRLASSQATKSPAHTSRMNSAMP